MHKNPVYLAFLGVLIGISLWYTVDALLDVFAHNKLTHKTEIASVNWEVKKLGSDRFVPTSQYKFQVNGEEYLGETTLFSPIYRNVWGVEQLFGELEEQYQKVWYEGKKPSHNSLQKKFPTKKCVTASVVWIIFIYFLGLGFYIGNKNHE